MATTTHPLVVQVTSLHPPTMVTAICGSLWSIVHSWPRGTLVSQGTHLNATMPLAAGHKCLRCASKSPEKRGTIPMTGYCLRCRVSREIQGARQVTMKNGRAASRGTCGECGTTMFRMGEAS